MTRNTNNRIRRKNVQQVLGAESLQARVPGAGKMQPMPSKGKHTTNVKRGIKCVCPSHDLFRGLAADRLN